VIALGSMWMIPRLPSWPNNDVKVNGDQKCSGNDGTSLYGLKKSRLIKSIQGEWNGFTLEGRLLCNNCEFEISH